MKVYNNFLNKKEFIKFKSVILSSNFPWYLNNVTKKTKNKYFQMTHTFSNEKEINSSFFNEILPILRNLKCKTLLSSKINLLHKTEKIIEHDFHTDYKDNKNLKTAVYYINTNNGYTKFVNKKVKSEENKIVIFNSNTLHTGTSCTNKKYRICLNINYYE
jgi:hypothetical protein